MDEINTMTDADHQDIEGAFERRYNRKPELGYKLGNVVYIPIGHDEQPNIAKSWKFK